MKLHESSTMTSMVASIEVKNSKDYQLVYASQLYGTFFVIGARLVLSGEDLIGIELALNNYKGLYNIGILKDAQSIFEREGEKALITLHLQVDNGKNSDKLVRKVTLNLEDKIPVADLKELHFTRELHSLTQTTKLEKHLDEAIFDSEFYDRNGKYIASKERLDTKLPKPDFKKFQKIVPKGDPRTNCMNSLIRLI